MLAWPYLSIRDLLTGRINLISHSGFIGCIGFYRNFEWFEYTRAVIQYINTGRTKTACRLDSLMWKYGDMRGIRFVVLYRVMRVYAGLGKYTL